MKRDPIPELDAPDLGVLRFLTCGSVDDGKSTLIGRLLYDTRALQTDTLATLARHAARRGLAAPDLSLLTDGLIAEREQGITIDVAYRYFATARRKFIIADSPGHEQYTRNMVTAASTADVAVLLVDARKGLLPQTQRHAALAALLGIRRMVLAVNKMDLVRFQRESFDAIVSAFDTWRAQHPEFDFDVHALPLSALDGDMVVDRGARLHWYRGPTLVEWLEATPAEQRDPTAALRLPVQWVCRLSQSDLRAYAGRIESGRLAVGDAVRVLPSGLSSRVTAIYLGETALDCAVTGQSVLVQLADERDISRGDTLVAADDHTTATTTFYATLCWLHASPLSPARSYALRHGTRETRAVIGAVRGRLDVQALQWQPASAQPVGLNDIVQVSLRTRDALALLPYAVDRAAGSFILVDETTHDTVAAGMVSR